MGEPLDPPIDRSKFGPRMIEACVVACWYKSCSEWIAIRFPPSFGVLDPGAHPTLELSSSDGIPDSLAAVENPPLNDLLEYLDGRAPAFRALVASLRVVDLSGHSE